MGKLYVFSGHLCKCDVMFTLSVIIESRCGIAGSHSRITSPSPLFCMAVDVIFQRPAVNGHSTFESMGLEEPQTGGGVPEISKFPSFGSGCHRVQALTATQSSLSCLNMELCCIFRRPI